MTKACGNCKHWTPDPDGRWGWRGWQLTVIEKWEDDEAKDGIDVYGDELPPVLDPPYATCAAVPFFCKPEAQTALAVVRDGSGYSGQLITRADFGCNLWEPKP